MPRALAAPLCVIVVLVAIVYLIGEARDTRVNHAARAAQAEVDGRAAALAGLPADACPYSPALTTDAAPYTAWKKGWAAGFLAKANPATPK